MQAIKEEREARSEQYACFGDGSDYNGSVNSYPEVNWDWKMRAADEKANKDAAESWFRHYSKLQSNMPSVPTSNAFCACKRSSWGYC